jgi:hypothetical protein
MICDICGEPIEPGQPYYEMPDGLIVCAGDTDCLSDWAEEYKRAQVVL